VVERAITLKRDGPITAEDLGSLVFDHERADLTPVSVASAGAPDPTRIQTLAQLERDHLTRLLTITAGNKKRAAELLGMSRRTLYRMVERFGLETNERST